MDMKNHKQHVEREGMSRREFLKELGIGICIAGVGGGLALNYISNEPVIGLPEKDYQIGQVIEIQTESGKKLRRQITSPKDVADVLLENPKSLNYIPSKIRDSYDLSMVMEEMPENRKYKDKWYNLPKGTKFKGFALEPSYK